MSGVWLRSGGCEAQLLPALGGAIGVLRMEGRDILRPTPAGATDPLETACFPLAPYANRIAEGRFAWNGRTYELPRNLGDHPHPLHGTGWRAPWAIERREEDAAILSHRHDGGPAWPWPFVVRQVIRLAPARIGLTLELTNLAEEAMPAGLGFHPYFPIRADTLLRARLGRPWLADAQCLPTVRGHAGQLGDWSAPCPPVAPILIDHCFEWAERDFGIAQTEGRLLTVTTTGALAWLHLYLPERSDFFCVEPVSHMPDAINRAGVAGNGLVALAPGACLTASMTLALS